MNRADFQTLAEIRIAEAQSLFAAGFCDGAYYVAGYAVECALKACIARLTNQDDFPRDRKFVEDCYNHDAERLVKSAGRGSALDAELAANPTFELNWMTVKDWEETSRYAQKMQGEAQTLYDA